MTQAEALLAEKASSYLMAMMVLIILIICGLIMLRQREKEKAEEARIKRLKAERNFSRERAEWAGLADERLNSIGELVTEVNRLRGEVDTLKKLLDESERLRHVSVNDK